MMLRNLFGMVLMMCFVGIQAQSISKEEDVPAYTLPDLLVTRDGKQVVSREDWERVRRPELLRLFQDEMFGRFSKGLIDMRFEMIKEDRHALHDRAVRREVMIRFFKGKREVNVLMEVYLPRESHHPVPVFIGLNFQGNYTINADTGITLKPSRDGKIRDRGLETAQWPLEELVKRGYGLITACYQDFEPDQKEGFKDGVRALFYEQGTQPDSLEWGAIAGWAWGLSRMLDYALQERGIDSHKIAVIGHSRLGKAALWAGVTDSRFAAVISNNSGCGGAALSKRIFGETVGIVNSRFPQWFCGSFKKYSQNEQALPFDQHELLALVAPRLLYVASAEEDLWSDPQGEFLSAWLASPVYTLYGKEGLPNGIRPPVNTPIMKSVGYHIRAGKHDITLYDWQRYMDFLDGFFVSKN